MPVRLCRFALDFVLQEEGKPTPSLEPSVPPSAALDIPAQPEEDAQPRREQPDRPSFQWRLQKLVKCPTSLRVPLCAPKEHRGAPLCIQGASG